MGQRRCTGRAGSYDGPARLSAPEMPSWLFPAALTGGISLSSARSAPMTSSQEAHQDPDHTPA